MAKIRCQIFFIAAYAMAVAAVAAYAAAAEPFRFKIWRHCLFRAAYAAHTLHDATPL